MLRLPLLRLAAYGLLYGPLYGRLATAASTVAYTVDSTNRKGSRSSQSLYEKRKKVLVVKLVSKITQHVIHSNLLMSHYFIFFIHSLTITLFIINPIPSSVSNFQINSLTGFSSLGNFYFLCLIRGPLAIEFKRFS